MDLTANAVAAVDSHLRKPNTRSQIESSADDNGRKLVRSRSVQTEEVSSSRGGSVARMKRRTKQLRRTQLDNTENGAPSSPEETKRDSLDRRNSFDRPESFNRFNSSDDREVLNRHHSLSVVQGQIRGTQINDAQINLAEDNSSTPDEETRGWEERVGEGEVERAVLALVEVGQVPAARQLQLKLAPTHVPLELLLVEAAQKIATLSMPTAKWSAVPAFLHPTVVECLLSTKFFDNYASVTPMQVHITHIYANVFPTPCMNVRC